MQGLPLEIKTRIALNLGTKDAASLARVGKEWNKAAIPALWKEVVIWDDNYIMPKTKLATQMGPVRLLRRYPELRSHVKTLRFEGNENGAALPVLGDMLEIVGTTIHQLIFNCRGDCDSCPENAEYFRLKVLDIAPFSRVRRFTYHSVCSGSMACLGDIIKQLHHVRELDIEVYDDYSLSDPIGSFAAWPILSDVVKATFSMASCSYNDVRTLAYRCPQLASLNLLAECTGCFYNYNAPVQGTPKTWDFTNIQHLRVTASCSHSAEVSAGLLERMASVTSLQDVTFAYQNPDGMPLPEWVASPLAPHVSSLIIDCKKCHDPVLEITSDLILEHIPLFCDNSSLVRLLVSRPISTGDHPGVEWVKEWYDGVLLRSYTDSSGQRSLLHFRYTKNTVKQSKLVGSDSVIATRRWRSLAMVGDKVIPGFTLKKIYAKINQPMKWTEPGRGFVLPDEFWSWLGDESIDVDDEMEGDCEEETEEKMDCT